MSSKPTQTISSTDTDSAAPAPGSRADAIDLEGLAPGDEIDVRPTAGVPTADVLADIRDCRRGV